MLADEILAHDGEGYALYTALMGPLHWKAAIRRAVRFEMLPQVIESARVLQAQPIDARLRALAIARLPYQTCWFEWPGMQRGKRLRNGVPSTDDERPEFMAPQPRRMGALVETDETCQRGTISFAWVHGDDLMYCPLAFSFDFTDDPQAVECIPFANDEIQARLREWQVSGKIEGRYHNSSIGAVQDYIRRVGVIASPLSPDTISPARLRRMPHPDMYMRQALLDITAEDDAILSLLILMNARNLIRITDRPAPPKLNKARARRGKPPLLDFHEVRIHLSRALAARAGTGIGGRGAVDPHLVRGHFKIRASGVYWWSPHVRSSDAGHGPVTTPKYTVTM